MGPRRYPISGTVLEIYDGGTARHDFHRYADTRRKIGLADNVVLAAWKIDRVGLRIASRDMIRYIFVPRTIRSINEIAGMRISPGIVSVLKLVGCGIDYQLTDTTGGSGSRANNIGITRAPGQRSTSP